MTTPDELQRAVERLKAGLRADVGTAIVSDRDLRLLLSERAELLATVEKMRGALTEIVNLCPATCETSDAHSMADIARAALTTGEDQ
jgi:hypothetical protein